MSMEAVASSMMKMLVFLTKARARQSSCLWPWLKFSPPSVMMASGGRHRRGGTELIVAVSGAAPRLVSCKGLYVQGTGM